MSPPLALEHARIDLGLTIASLWLAYFALGGTKSAAELGSYLIEGDPAGATATSAADHDAIVHALNEAYDEDRGVGYPLPYHGEPTSGDPRDNGR